MAGKLLNLAAYQGQQWCLSTRFLGAINEDRADVQAAHHQLFLVLEIMHKAAILVNLFIHYVDISNFPHITIDSWIYFLNVLYFLILNCSQNSQ